MQVTNPANVPVITDDHPTGALAMRYLVVGAENAPESYMMVLAENVGLFEMPPHRHPFEQFRYVISGGMKLGPHERLRAGELAYFPEGASYGPQEDEAGPLVLTLQFGGASGFGYLSPEQYRAGRAKLRKKGRFEGPVFIRELADGKTKRTFSINAIWEEELGSKMLIPTPRYERVVYMKPEAFRWIKTAGASNVFHKTLGVFSERLTTAEMLLLKPGATLELRAGDAYRLYFVLDGSGTFATQAFAKHFGASLDPGENATLRATSELKLLAFTLPLIGMDWQYPETPNEEPVPDESVAVHA